MNKPIIIDGVDVSECEFYTDRLYTICNSGCSAYADDCKSEYRKDCYYKQLQRLKAENERNHKALEEVIEIAYTTDFDIRDIQKIVNEVLKDEIHN